MSRQGAISLYRFSFFEGVLPTLLAHARVFMTRALVSSGENVFPLALDEKTRKRGGFHSCEEVQSGD